jgi:asparagine synthase (glutamine-hydrolysing)
MIDEIRTYLSDEKAYRWYKADHVYSRGYLITNNMDVYSDESLAQLFSKFSNASEVEMLLKSSSGSFSAIVSLEDQTLLISDIIRSLPLFYYISSKSLIISDHPDEIIRNLNINPPFNKVQEYVFKHSGYTLEQETLYQGLYQTQAGKIVSINKDSTQKRNSYLNYLSFDHATRKDSRGNQFKQTIHKVFDKLIKFTNGRQLVVPLSGGYDSRLIASMLRLKNYNNVVCFTYGKKDNKEIGLSSLVAKRLNYKWHFIEYSAELIKDYLKEKDFCNYYNYAAHGSSMFYLQEYFAVQQLKKKKLIEDDAIFLPGHSGDFLGGSQITKFNIRKNISAKGIIKSILDHKINFNLPLSKNQKKALRRHISHTIHNAKKAYPKAYGYSILENWDIKEKLSKYNANSSLTFTYFGYKVYFPFWDNELIDLFSEIPYEDKLVNKYYNYCLEELIFKKTNTFFHQKLQPSKIDLRKQLIKNKIKRFFPDHIKHYLLCKRDWSNHKQITAFMERDMKDHSYPFKLAENSFAETIIQWYLFKMKQK